ncbi:hypothetical protein C5748_18145 [Phyllobacterium phragmitis]|uniref:Putative exodeoxyribonuclease 8 PDDEXK-like domain-containing protein n=2 Tax=Phyllobacterium phragmitis TaxID=2670329 RepID=A0A2S9INP8_9HYPH|nr:hypothetical protein C5748_18145 [Phyllobacterium phragmitis]
MQPIGGIVNGIVKGLSGERLWDGKRISEPGIIAKLPINVYHSDCCVAPSISSSGLREIAPPEGCPLKFWDNSYLNPDRAPQVEKDHFSLGRAVHTLLLGEDGFKDDFAVRPDEFPDYRTNAAKAWRAKQIAAGKTVLKNDDLIAIEGMANRVINDRDFIDHLGGRVERTLIIRDQKTGLFIKARPDAIPADTTIADLKTTADASERGCLTSIKKYNYHMQLALAGTALEILNGRQITDHVLLFIEPKRPYAYNIKPVDNQYIWYGARQNRAALDIFADCMSKGFWPTYYSSGYTASPSDFFEKQIENEPSIPAEAA